MRITTDYSKKEYLSALKERMDSHFRFGAERCTGYFLGPVICVTYHSGKEWDRRITNQRNTAVGFARKDHNGCIVKCVIVKGLLGPQYFLPVFLAMAFYLLFLLNVRYGSAPIHLWLPGSLAMTAAITVLSALQDSLTERGDAGRKILISILLDPKDPFSCLNNQNKIK